VVLVFAVGALAAPLGAPAAKPRLVSKPAAVVGVPWVGVVVASTKPVVSASLGSVRQRVTVQRAGRGRFRLRTTFRSPGRWVLSAGRQRLGSVLVRPAPLRLTNAADVVVEPGGTLLVADLSNRIFRQSGNRLSVVAGNGRAGRSGDGGPALRAAIGFPVEVALDPRGGFGIVHDERWIRHVAPDGTIRTVAEFAQPTALAYDAAGNLFVSELPGRVQRVDAVTGARTVYGGFSQPHGLDVAADGTVYVCDTFANRIQRIAPDGTITTLAAGLNLPVDLDVGPDGNIYVADFGGNRILRVTPSGTVTVIPSDARGTNSVAVAPDGAVYVTERGRATIKRITVAGFLAFRPARAGVAWTALVRAVRRPAVTARNGVTVQPVAVRALGGRRFRLRAVFPFSGRWTLQAGRRRLGSVSVRPAAPLASDLPGAEAFRLCGGSTVPYPQYAISIDPGGALWSACWEQGRLLRVDPATGEIRAILRVSAPPYSLAAGFGAAWSADRSGVVSRIDLRTGRVTTAATGGRFAYIWTAAGSVWAHDDERSRLLRYDPRARRVTAELATGDGTSALVEEAGGIWIVNHRDGTLERIDPATNALTRLSRLPGDAPERIVFSHGSLWVTGRGTDLLRVDPATGAVQAIVDIGAGAIDVRAAGGSIWVVAPTAEEDARGNPFLDRVLRIDPSTNQVAQTIRPTGRIAVTGTAASGPAFWIADHVRGRLYRFVVG
jgi:streptogramin lyase